MNSNLLYLTNQSLKKLQWSILYKISKEKISNLMLIEVLFQSSYWFLNYFYKMPGEVQDQYVASTLDSQKEIPGHKAHRLEVSQSRPKMSF